MVVAQRRTIYHPNWHDTLVTQPTIWIAKFKSQLPHPHERSRNSHRSLFRSVVSSLGLVTFHFISLKCDKVACTVLTRWIRATSFVALVSTAVKIVANAVLVYAGATIATKLVRLTRCKTI